MCHQQQSYKYVLILVTLHTDWADSPDRLVEDEERRWNRENIDTVALKHFPNIDRDKALNRPILYSNWPVQGEWPADPLPDAAADFRDDWPLLVLLQDYVPVEQEELPWLGEGQAEGVLRGGAGRSSGALQWGSGSRAEDRQVQRTWGNSCFVI